MSAELSLPFCDGQSPAYSAVPKSSAHTSLGEYASAHTSLGAHTRAHTSSGMCPFLPQDPTPKKRKGSALLDSCLQIFLHSWFARAMNFPGQDWERVLSALAC